MVPALYTGWIIICCQVNPELAPGQEKKAGITEIFRGLLELLPVLLLILLVIPGIYSGLATPSEAAALGASALAVLMVIATGQTRLQKLLDSARSAILTSSMICTVLVAASFLSTAMGFLHLPQDLALQIKSMTLEPWQLILLLGIFYVLLGLFLDGISITVMVLPITLPLIIQAGFDPVWFGVFVVIMVELGLITPPVGFNLFVLQGLTGQPVGMIARAAFPFFLLLALAGILLVLFPEIALWLPSFLRE